MVSIIGIGLLLKRALTGRKKYERRLIRRKRKERRRREKRRRIREQKKDAYRKWYDKNNL